MTMTNKIIDKYFLRAHKPQTKEEFGYFLAGLIDGDGHINKLGYIIIVFAASNISVAYYIKKIIDHGSIKMITKKQAYTYVCSHSLGITKIRHLICNKLIIPEKIKQFNSRPPKRTLNRELMSKEINEVSAHSHWLAGFIQADGSFQIKIYNRVKRKKKEIRLVIQIDQKNTLILKQIKRVFGGYIGYRKSQDTYYYSSISFSNANKFIKYLDCYQVMGNTLKQYWLWREAYIFVQNKQHLTEAGIAAITNLKIKMSKFKKQNNIELY